MKPFRWDIARREQLGRLLDGPPAPDYPEYLDDLVETGARVVEASGDGDLVFVGRSVEGLYDFFRGLFRGTAWAQRLIHFNVSLRWRSTAEATARRAAFARHLEAVGLGPADIARRARSVALVDVVSDGITMGELIRLVLASARVGGVDANAVRRRLRVVAITWRGTPSPKAYRWWQRRDWTKALKPAAIRGVSADGRLWAFLGNNEDKVAAWNPPDRWDVPREVSSPSQVSALRLARRVYEAGLTRAWRERFAARLAATPGMKEAWVRALVGALRRTSRPGVV